MSFSLPSSTASSSSSSSPTPSSQSLSASLSLPPSSSSSSYPFASHTVSTSTQPPPLLSHTNNLILNILVPILAFLLLAAAFVWFRRVRQKQCRDQLMNPENGGGFVEMQGSAGQREGGRKDERKFGSTSTAGTEGTLSPERERERGKM